MLSGEDKNHRLIQREELHLPLQICYADKVRIWFPVWMKDASPNGICFEVPAEFPIDQDTPIHIRFQINKEDYLPIGVGFIRHISTRSGNIFIGLEFEEQSQLFFGVAMVGVSPQILKIKSLIPKLAKTDFNIMIRGETGTGKNILAKVIHNLCRGEERPFIRVNCPAIPESLFESELFGHKKGAYTDAKSASPGYFRMAANGTLVLDEISEIKPHLQAKLLNVLEERQFIPVGGHEPVPVHAKIIATSNRDLEKAVSEGSFRQDLFYRFSEMPLHLPPLRKRPEDIPVLAQYFLTHYYRQFGLKPQILTKSETQVLKEHSWPGNIRELENFIKRTALLGKFTPPQRSSSRPEILDTDSSLPHEQLQKMLKQPTPLPERIKLMSDYIEQFLITEELVKCSQNKTEAARHLGISYRTLLRKLEHYRFSDPQVEQPAR